MGARAPGQAHPAELARERGAAPDAATARGERLAERAAPPGAGAAAGPPPERARGGHVPWDGAAASTEGKGLAAFLSGERARPEAGSAVPGRLPASSRGMHLPPSLPRACWRLATPPNEP